VELLEDRLVPSGAGSTGGNPGANFNDPKPLDIPDYFAQLSPAIKSTLGSVVTAETPTADGFGRYETFQHGEIWFSNFTGAHALYGDIYQKWVSMHWYWDVWDQQNNLLRTLYYPSTDITSLANGDLYAHFTALDLLQSREDVAAIDDVGTWPSPINQKQGFGGQQGVQVQPQPRAESFVASAIDGPIAQKFASLGWEDWGEAVTGVTAAPDGMGQFAHFQPARQGYYFEAIDWTPDFGTHDVNWINGGMFRHEGAEGKLGEAISDTVSTPDHQGKSNHFVDYVNGQPTSFAAIDWTQKYGPQCITGDRALKFKNLGWEAFGEAITEVTQAPDGVGKFVHFLQGGHFRAIDWTPDYGLHTVDDAVADSFFENNVAEHSGEAVTDVTSQAYVGGFSGTYVHLYDYAPDSPQHDMIIDSSQYGTWLLDGFLAEKFLELGGEKDFGLVTWVGKTNDGGFYCWVSTVKDPDPNPHFIYTSPLGDATGEIDGQMYLEWIKHGAKVDQWGVVVDPGPFGYPTSAVEHKAGGVLESQFQHGAIQVNTGEPIGEFWVLQQGNTNDFRFYWTSSHSYWFFLVSDQFGQQDSDYAPQEANKAKSSGSWDYYLSSHTTYAFNVDPATTYGTYGGTDYVGWMTPMDFIPGQVGPPPPPSGQQGSHYGWSPADIVFGAPLTYEGPAPTADQGFTVRWTDKNLGGDCTGSTEEYAYWDWVDVRPFVNNNEPPDNFDGYTTHITAAQLCPGGTNDQQADIPGLPAGDYVVDVWLPNDFAEMLVHVLEDPYGQSHAPAPRQGPHLPPSHTSAPSGNPALGSHPAVSAAVAMATATSGPMTDSRLAAARATVFQPVSASPYAISVLAAMPQGSATSGAGGRQASPVSAPISTSTPAPLTLDHTRVITGMPVPQGPESGSWKRFR
jgi:hypothetical protein